MCPQLFKVQAFVNAFVQTGVILAAGLIPQAVSAATFDCANDSRCEAVRSFFVRHKSPLVHEAESFVDAADLYNLDWRLLPAISMVESSGGKYCRQHNLFGWDSGKVGFVSVPHAIHYVASRFFSSPIYRGKSTRGILETYNPARSIYPEKVIEFMRLLSPDPVH